VYHDALMKCKSRNDFNRLCNLHTLGMIGEDNGASWQCSKMIEYNQYREAGDEHQHNCLVEWKNINKIQSWVNFFALSLGNPTPIIKFARANNALHKMPSRNLVYHCKGKTGNEFSRVQNIFSIPTLVFKYPKES
jgi:hypothetical protein